MVDDPTVSDLVSKLMASPGGADGTAPDPNATPPVVVPPVAAPPAPLKMSVPADPQVVPPVVPPVVSPVVPPAAVPADPYANVPSALVTPPPPADDFNVASIDVSGHSEDMQLNWGKARAKIERQDVLIAEDARTRAALTVEVEALKAAGGNVQEADAYKTLVTERDTLLDELSKVSLANNPQFNAKFDARTSQAKALLVGLGNSFESLPEDWVDQAANRPPAARAEYLKTILPEGQEGMVLPYLVTLDMIENEKRAEIENHAVTLEALEKDASTETEAKFVALRDDMQAKAMDSMKADILFQTVEGNEPWNKGVANLTAQVDTLFKSTDPEVQAKAFVLSVTAPVYEHLLHLEQDKTAMYEKAITDRNIALPTVNADIPPVNPVVAPAMPAGGFTPANAAKMAVNGGSL